MNNRLSWSQVALIFLVLFPGCSDSKSKSGGLTAAELSAACVKVCEKEASCAGDAGAAMNDQCAQACSLADVQGGADGQSSGTFCSYGLMKAKFDQCATVDCNQLPTCQQEAAAICPNTLGGTGGFTSGTGGAGSGTGGAGSGTGGFVSAGGGSSADAGTCADCDKANVCCRSQPGETPASCDAKYSQASCLTQGQEMAGIILACGGLAALCP